MLEHVITRTFSDKKSDITIGFYVIGYPYESCLTWTLYTILGHEAVFRTLRHPLKNPVIVEICHRKHPGDLNFCDSA